MMMVENLEFKILIMKSWLIAILQSGKSNHYESCYFSPQLQQIRELKETTMLE